MPQSKIVVLGLIAVIVIGGGYMALKSPKASPEVQEQSGKTNTEQVTESEPKVNEEGTTETAPTQNGKKMAFSEFLKQGGAYKCTVNQYMQGTDVQGTVFINGDKIHADYNIAVQGMTIDSSMTVRDGYSYTWSSMMPGTGYKSKVVASSDTSVDGTDTSGTYAWNAEQIGDYNCEAWNHDEETFALPAGVTFTEVGY